MFCSLSELYKLRHNRPGRVIGRRTRQDRRARLSMCTVANGPVLPAGSKWPIMIATSANIKEDCAGRVIVIQHGQRILGRDGFYEPGSSRMLCIAHFAQRDRTTIKNKKS